MGSQPPPGLLGANTGTLPSSRVRMAQEAFEAYGKSSPLPALPHLPFPPAYVPPPVSMGTGGSRHGTLNTSRRRGDYRQGAAAAPEPVVQAHTKEKGVKVPCVLATCLCLAPNARHNACRAPQKTEQPGRGAAGRTGSTEVHEAWDGNGGHKGGRRGSHG